MRGSIRTDNRYLLRSDMITASLRRLLLALVLCTGSIALVRADHPYLDVMFPLLSSGAGGPEDKPFLRRAAESSQRHIRGTAQLALAKYLASEAQSIPAWRARLGLVETDPEKFDDDVKLCRRNL